MGKFVPPHIVFDVSGHGFGHAGMCLPVLKALKVRQPDFRLTLRSSLPEQWLRDRLRVPFDYRPSEDFGMAMFDGLRVDAPTSLAYYVDLHARWDAVIEDAAAAVLQLRADLLVSNISYISLAAATAVGVDAVAYSSLNWADVFWAYCADLPGAALVRARMAEAYATAALFLQPTPSMAMPSIVNGRPTKPVVKRGLDRSAEIRTRLGLPDGVRLALVSMGGIATPIDTAVWPSLEGWRIILGSDERPSHHDVSSWAELDMSFIDCLASSSVVIIKPGYGLITEAVCHGKPLLYLPRDTWPETPAELAWVAENGVGERLDEATLRAGTFAAALTRLAASPMPPPPQADGAFEVADLLLARL